MKKIICLSLFILFIPAILYAQDKVAAPVWNVGDKWTLTGDVTVTVMNADESSYAVKYLMSGGGVVLIFEKTSLNRLFAADGETRKPYEGRNKKLFNFPLEIGKSWVDKYKEGRTEYTETFTPVGWEEVAVQAGKFKALKIEYKQTKGEAKEGRKPREGRVWYWYSPDVKYMVKCQWEKARFWDETFDWELASFEIKK
jgi:hypothetical protein